MSETVCPLCEMSEVLELEDHHECVTCGHEWPRQEEARVVRDAHGNVLADGDVVAMVKDLKLRGSSEVLKIGTKSRPIRLQDGDHEISCRMDGLALNLKAMYVKKVG